MDKFAKRLQSRLSAKGHRFNKEECRQALMCASATPLEPTEEEMMLAFNRLVASAQEETQAIVPVEAEEIIQDQELSQESQELSQESQELSQESQELSQEPKTQQSSLTVPENSSPMAQAPVSGISQASMTQAVDQAIARLGINGNEETVGILTQLADQLTDEIQDLEQMTTRLMTLFLAKRQNILSSAIGTLDSLRSAQSSSFQAGLDPSFFERKNRNKQQFMSQIEAAFN